MDRTTISYYHHAHRNLTSHSPKRRSSTVQNMPPSSVEVATTSRKPSTTTIDMMHTIQKDFAACRSMMLDIQSRLWLLERKSSTHGITTVPYNAVSSGEKPTTDFLNLPKRLSAFRFDFEEELAEAPAIEDVPALSPTTRSLAESKTSRPRYSVFPPATKNDHMFEMRKAHARLSMVPRERVSSTRPSARRAHTAPTTNKHSSLAPVTKEDDIIEQIVDVNLMARPAPPFIQSPPLSRRSRVISHSRESLGNDITALPAMPAPLMTGEIERGQKRYSRSLRSLLGSRGSVRSLKRSSCV